MTTSGITNINAKLIHQHPDNPRKDLGDLTDACPKKYNRRRISGHISQNQINPQGISPDNSLVSRGSVPCRDNSKSTQFTGLVFIPE